MTKICVDDGLQNWKGRKGADEISIGIPRSGSRDDSASHTNGLWGTLGLVGTSGRRRCSAADYDQRGRSLERLDWTKSDVSAVVRPVVVEIHGPILLRYRRAPTQLGQTRLDCADSLEEFRLAIGQSKSDLVQYVFRLTLFRLLLTGASVGAGLGSPTVAAYGS